MKVLLPFLKLFRRQWLMMVTGLLLSFITLLAGVGLLSLSGWFLSATAVAGLTVLTAQSFNFFTPAGGVRFLSIARTASRYGERLATHEATFKLLTDLRVWAWQKLLPLSAANLQGLRKGDLLNRLVADIDTLDHLYLRLLIPMSASLLMIAALYVFIAWFDPSLALTLCGFLLVVLLVLPAVFYRLGKVPGQTLIETKQRFRVQLLDVIQGQAELSLFAANQDYLARIYQQQHRFFSSQLTMAKITGLSQAILILTNGFAVLLMLYVAAKGVGEAVPPGPLFAMVVFATMACLEMMMPVAGAFQHLSSTVLAAERVSGLTEQAPAVQFATEQHVIAQTGALDICNLHFSYQENQPILQGINLKLAAGDKVAILGKTGCGKSSLLNMITREWQSNAGSILLDGQSITNYTEANLRAAMSVVSQRVHLFSGTLRDNLVLALPYIANEKRSAHDDKLKQVLSQVGLGHLLMGDKPLNMWMGEGGRQLSGGEQRRIGVARALLRDAPLLLLDEPTEGLDKHTEREILATLFAFAEHKTVLMISHRTTALNQMDGCYQLIDGKLQSFPLPC
ncbi:MULTISPECIES: heme ABC transporter ATP-binding protein/permease CydC [Pseudomonadati]|uniref:Cysteine/glutathione ABC transporter ATP-binding protein/permease CydC n=1 Tax=Shewanella aestuarii TaxID=1028752 RepID=A0ABT0L1I3_9GAMM|nr:cysteine/glutathione ABC transporter ATP-binding protein/permease CydC [Shewanella aestuarii]MCL1117569.1 cysteine/glutathione ABC transporter ATP-binding protein/permease CydC [Shewanella aestuarii]GGN75317.1 cysteine/glutathione ABC transporter ATP-binding protein/permease CydC [Shewanella aestuarii]